MSIAIQTNMNCSGCLSKLQPHLDNHPSIKDWKADLDDPNKILFVDLVADANVDPVLELIRENGFEAVVIPE